MSRANGSVTIDLQAAQSPHYRERGIARYALDYTKSVTRAAPELFGQVLVNPKLPLTPGVDDLRRYATVTALPDWDGGGRVFHVLSPFELDIPVAQLWPRQASRRGMQLIVTLYDLIPEIFPDVYLQDPGQRRRYRARRELIRAADHVVTLSRSAANDAMDYLGVPAERLTVVGAAPSEIFKPPTDRPTSLSTARKQIPGLADRFIVYNGAVEPRKNMEALLEAFASLPPPLHRTVQLVLVCRVKPEERNHFEIRAQQLGVGSQLLLTGFLPDDQLVLLYQSAELVVYPSMYEGYGLPIAEALACGAPVIGSSSSSLPELVAPSATFDPRSTAAISKALERALSDQAFRSELLEWASTHRSTWDDVASAALAVYEDVLSRPTTDRWRRRPRVAFVSPWPPARTGVADYTERLIEGFDDTVDIDLFVDGDPLPGAGSCPRADSLPARDRAIGGYDQVVLAVGNSEFHAGALKLLRVDRMDAILHAHDARLTGLYLHGEARGAVPEGFRAAVSALYPELKPELEGSDDPRDVAEQHGALMAKEIAALAREVLATSEEAAEMIRNDCEPGDRKKISVWEYAYPDPVQRDETQIEDDLICSLGLVNRLKAPDTVVRAIAELSRESRKLRLAFVGPISDSLHEDLTDLAKSLSVSERIHFTGNISDDDYRSWLRRASIAIQLRAASNGETSGAVADCLAYGIPVIVTKLGPQAGLPRFVPKVEPEVSSDGLAAVAKSLLEDCDRRRSFTIESRRFVESRGFQQSAKWFLEHLAS
ncbi:MAG TPA: glycosyltransferase [Acidimicrobiales bacterium]|nr:glycosyltransferase [Acidimicrobiales bacterium]